MLQSYVGIVSRRGLELFYPEHPHTVQFLQQRVRREQGRVAGIWSVLTDEGVLAVQARLGLGDLREALVTLQIIARDCGVLPPCDPDDQAPCYPAIPLP